jgi:hypothetical protein
MGNYRLQECLKVRIGWCRRCKGGIGIKYGNILIMKEHDSDISAYIMELTDVASCST